MLQNEYRREMEKLGPRPAELERLYELIDNAEGGKQMKHVKRLGRSAVAAIAICAALLVSAAAAGPTIRDMLNGALGDFAPYSQSIEGAVCTDQGIEIQVLSALADDVRGYLYLSVRDTTGDRLDECLTLTGNVGTAKQKQLTQEEDDAIRVDGFNLWNFSLVSYDPETKTALLVSNFRYGARLEPAETAHFTASKLSTTGSYIDGGVSLAPVTAETLESLPLGPEDDMFFTPGSVSGWEYDDTCLPQERVVLAPDQNPMPIEGTEDIWISSIGFASDGCFHVRLAFAEGVDWVHEEHGSSFLSCLEQKEGIESRIEYCTIAETQVAGGMDILFPLFHPEDLADFEKVDFYGPYTRPGVDIEGEWSIEFPFEYMPSQTLDWTGELAGRQVEQVTLSPMTVTMKSNDTAEFSRVSLYAVLQDGTTVTGKRSSGTYNNVSDEPGVEVWAAWNTWEFEEPVDLEQVVALELLGERIPVNP